MSSPKQRGSGRQPRVLASLPPSEFAQLKAMAQRDRRSLSNQVSVLLSWALAQAAHQKSA